MSPTLTPQQLRQQNWGKAVADLGARIAIHDSHFAAHPHEVYDYMRHHYGSVVPVAMAPDLGATLVIGYAAAVKVVNTPEQFPADPSAWQKKVRPDHAILPMVGWRPNALRSSGAVHTKYREAINNALAGVDVRAIRNRLRYVAGALIDTFCSTGTAELIGDYARPLVFAVLNELLGCSPEIGARIAGATARAFEGNDTADVNAILNSALAELVSSKRTSLGRDVTSAMVAHGALSVEQMCHQLFTIYAAGIEPVVNLIINAILKMLTDPRFVSSVDRIGLGVGEAINEILILDPPMAAHHLTYPRRPSQIDGVWVPADEPVIISLAACNRDPEVAHSDLSGNGWSGGPSGGWGLGYGSGPHACPGVARILAHYIAHDAIGELFDRLPDLTPLTNDRRWRPGPFHRALTELEVSFGPTDHTGTPLAHRDPL